MTIEELYNKVSKQDYIVDGEYIYYKGNVKMGLTDFEVLCRVEVKHSKKYILNKAKNNITDSEELYNDYLKRKSEGVRGYKTIKIGYIEDYCSCGTPEWYNIGADGKHFWWRDWKYEVKSNVWNLIKNYVFTLSSEFIAA